MASNYRLPGFFFGGRWGAGLFEMTQNPGFLLFLYQSWVFPGFFRKTQAKTQVKKKKAWQKKTQATAIFEGNMLALLVLSGTLYKLYNKINGTAL